MPPSALDQPRSSMLVPVQPEQAVTFPIECLALQVRRLAASLVAVAGAVLAAVPVLHVQVGGAGRGGPVAELGQVTLRVGGGAALRVLPLELAEEAARTLLSILTHPPASSPLRPHAAPPDAVLRHIPGPSGPPLRHSAHRTHVTLSKTVFPQ